MSDKRVEEMEAMMVQTKRMVRSVLRNHQMDTDGATALMEEAARLMEHVSWLIKVEAEAVLLGYKGPVLEVARRHSEELISQIHGLADEAEAKIISVGAPQ